MPAGESGEVVFTTLTREAMPLIRYRTGDLSRFAVDPCPCGSRLRLLEKVRTRLQNRVPLDDDGVVELAALDEALFSLPDILDFRARLEDDTVATLSLHVLSESADPSLERLLREKVEAITGIAHAVAKRRLRVELRMASGPWTSGDGTAKRTIVDSRQQGSRS
jgi:phenylacetate-CoA ligase